MKVQRAFATVLVAAAGAVAVLRPSSPQKKPAKSVFSRISARLSVLLIMVTGGTLAVASPAMAHEVVSETKVSVGAAARTIYGPTMYVNLNDLKIGCDSSFKASFTPTWRVSNVTSTSVYVDYMSYSLSASRNTRLGFTALVDGNNNEAWHGNWLEPSVRTTVKKYYFRKTVSFGRKGYLDLYQLMGFEQAAGAGGLCGNDRTISFFLRRS